MLPRQSNPYTSVCRCVRSLSGEPVVDDDVDERDEPGRASEGPADGLRHRASKPLRRTFGQTAEASRDVQADGELRLGLELVRHAHLGEQST